MSTINPNYGCATLGEWAVTAGCNRKKGGIMQIGFLHPGYTDDITDFESASELQAAIDAGTLTLVGGRGFKAEYPDASPIESDPADAYSTAQTLDGFEHVINVQDFNISAANDNFWESANTYFFDGIILKYAMSDEIRVIETPVTVKVSPSNAPLAPREKRRYAGTVSFSTAPDYFGVQYDAPAGIFERGGETV